MSYEGIPLVAELLGVVNLEVLAAVALECGEQSAHRELADGYGREVMLGVALGIVAETMDETHVFQLVEQASHESDGYLSRVRQLACRIGFLAFLKTLADERHHHHAKEVVVAATHVVGLLSEIV